MFNIGRTLELSFQLNKIKIHGLFIALVIKKKENNHGGDR